ncbi:OVARIAN TUMOR DOMAIN-containing deubiquitinating enzyme 2, partial [Hevea brasiliensis]|uniref:OVARIAN TUMOR DOMAIN-containing deubiquitinating enzyme 2 n=1 Tax=Hevea brasiliensis TaxID=3981 RepID=UPI0025E7961F
LGERQSIHKHHATVEVKNFQLSATLQNGSIKNSPVTHAFIPIPKTAKTDKPKALLSYLTVSHLLITFSFPEKVAVYVMYHDKNKGLELRQVIAATVASDPAKYNEAFLGKPNEEYCAWILDLEKWGGAIEISILADYYGCEIAAYDIQTIRYDLYGQDNKYTEREMLIYDGLHYDALAISPFEGALEEFDQTIFAVQNDRTIGPAEEKNLHGHFQLQFALWSMPNWSSWSEVEHAQATGHVNFQEYR